jgi:hypothetical protein
MTAILITLLSVVLLAEPAALPAGEVPPAKELPCFPGAFYRKAVSSDDAWTGIEATVTLPTLTTDPSRVNDKTKRPLDNASCYVGGRAGETEIDAGVSWEVIREADGSVSSQRKAFRPFWRNKQWQSGPAKPEYYYSPGDTIRLKCWTEQPGKLKLQIDLLSRAGQPTATAGDKPISTLSTEFDAPAFGPSAVQQFKRVCAIDQTGNEGKPAQPTNAVVREVIWRDVKLLRGTESRPMLPPRFTDMRCPDANLIRVTPLEGDETGERVEIRGK